MISRISKNWRWEIRAVWVVWGLLWFTATHTPIPPDAAKMASGWDKPIHFSGYLVLSLLTAAVFLKQKPFRFPVWKAGIGLLAFGAADEILQGPVGRSPELADWFANALGVAVGLTLAWLLTRAANARAVRRHSRLEFPEHAPSVMESDGVRCSTPAER